MKRRIEKPTKAPAAIAPVEPKQDNPLGATKPPAGIMTSEPVKQITGEWSTKNRDWLNGADRTKLVKDNPRIGGELVAVFSHRDNIMECGEIRKGQHGYVPALTYKWLHNFFNALDPKDAQEKVTKAEKEYSEL